MQKYRVTKSIIIASFVGVLYFCLMPGQTRAAEKYPSRPVELVCGHPPGGVTDLFNRLMSTYFEKYLKVTFVPVNKPGPAQMMVASYVAKSKPDGLTIGHISNQIITAEISGQASGYSMGELRPICQVGTNGLVIAVPIDSPWKTYQEFADYAQKNPGLKYGHFGIGSGPHQRMELLNKFAKLSLIGVPFKGEAEALPMLLGNHVPVSCLSPTTAKIQSSAGKVRILASFDDPKDDGLDPSIPDLGSINKGMPDLPTSIFLWAPRETPDDIVKTIDNAFLQMTKDAEFMAEIKKKNISLKHVNTEEVEKNVLPALNKQYTAALEMLGLVKK